MICIGRQYAEPFNKLGIFMAYIWAGFISLLVYCVINYSLLILVGNRASFLDRVVPLIRKTKSSCLL